MTNQITLLLRKKHIRGLGLLVIMTLSILLFLHLNKRYFANGRYQLISTDSNHIDVMRDFSYGLMLNDSYVLKKIVVQDSWSHVDKWVSEHQPVKCRNSLEDRIGELLDPSEYMFWDGEHESDDGTEAILINNYLFGPGRCVIRSETAWLGYSHRVQNLTLKPTSDGWKIAGWKCIRETFHDTGKPDEEEPCIE